MLFPFEGFHLSGLVTPKSSTQSGTGEPEKRYRVSITFDRYCDICIFKILVKT